MYKIIISIKHFYHEQTVAKSHLNKTSVQKDINYLTTRKFTKTEYKSDPLKLTVILS